MIDFLINGIASFLGGYFSQQTVEKRISIKKFFFLIFLLILTISFCYQAIIGKIAGSEILFGFLVASIGASFCASALFIYLKIKTKKYS